MDVGQPRECQHGGGPRIHSAIVMYRSYDPSWCASSGGPRGTTLIRATCENIPPEGHRPMRDDPEIGDDEGAEDYWMDEDAGDPSDVDVDEIRLPGSRGWSALIQETTFPDLRIVRTFDTGQDLRWGTRRGEPWCYETVVVEVAHQDRPLRWRIYQTRNDAEEGHRAVCTAIAELLNYLARQPLTPPTGVQ